LNVRFWHKADISIALSMSAFGGKADMRGYIAIRRLDTGFALAIYPG
jgi:hypothetical protein